MQNISLPTNLRKYEVGNRIILQGILLEVTPLAQKISLYLQKESDKRKRKRNIYKYLPIYIIILLLGIVIAIAYFIQKPLFLTSFLFFPFLYLYLRKIRYVKCRYRYIFPTLCYNTLQEVLSRLQTENPHRKIHLKLYKSFYEKRLKYLLFLHSQEKRIFIFFKYLTGKTPFSYHFKIKKWKLFSESQTYTLYYKISLHYEKNIRLKISKILETGTKKAISEQELILKEFFVEYALF